MIQVNAVNLKYIDFDIFVFFTLKKWNNNYIKLVFKLIKTVITKKEHNKINSLINL